MGLNLGLGAVVADGGNLCFFHVSPDQIRIIQGQCLGPLVEELCED